MKLALPRLGLVSAAACLGLLGCEQWRSHAIRTDQSGIETPAGKTSDVDASVPRSDHASGSSPGGLSGRAKEIEGHFNVQ